MPTWQRYGAGRRGESVQVEMAGAGIRLSKGTGQSDYKGL